MSEERPEVQTVTEFERCSVGPNLDPQKSIKEDQKSDNVEW